MFIVKNRIIYTNYNIVREYNAGIVLQPCEVKYINRGSCSLAGSYCKITNLVVFLYKMYVRSTEYRLKMILLNKKEIININVYLNQGYVLIPMNIYKYNNLIKIKLMLAKYLSNTKRKRDKIDKKQLYREIREEGPGIIRI